MKQKYLHSIQVKEEFLVYLFNLSKEKWIKKKENSGTKHKRRRRRKENLHLFWLINKKKKKSVCVQVAGLSLFFHLHSPQDPIWWIYKSDIFWVVGTMAPLYQFFFILKTIFTSKTYIPNFPFPNCIP